ncbi:MAG TPA: hypothetical protein VNT99_18745 [Methylomirabilota bacterium]|nr:hypothetical protein [Methylomirabilota bacterium]
MMTSTRWRYGTLLLAAFALSTVSAMPPRKDINPALLYGQAFSRFPVLDESESTLLGHDNSGDPGAEERALASRFDDAFAFILRARAQKAPCDWGADPADGPKAITPNWIKVRTGIYAAVLRARIALADGDQARARDELLAGSVMSRHAATSASLVGTMIQVAAEMKVLDFMAAHFDQLEPPTRSEIVAGLQAPPVRATVADAMANERAGFQEWMLSRLEGFRAKDRDDAKVLAQFRVLIAENISSEPDLADRIIEASGGTSAGVVRYIKALEPHYARSHVIAQASARDIRRETARFEAEINATTNLLVRVVMPNVSKARMKELEFQARLARLPGQAP